MPSIYWLVLLAGYSVKSVEISRCCPQGQVLNLDNFTCQQYEEDTANRTHFTPQIYSLEAESFINEELQYSSNPQLPSCDAGFTLMTAVNSEQEPEQFLILSETSQLFIPLDTETHDTWCLDPEQGAAVWCGQDVASLCSADNVCVSLCCPQHMTVDADTGQCVFREEWSLEPPLAQDMDDEQVPLPNTLNIYLSNNFI